MAERKQSINDDQVVERTKSGGLPQAGVPNITNYEYSGEGKTTVPDDINAVEEDEVGKLEAPRNLQVVEQRIRFAPDGTQYVTVVIEFDSVKSAEGYEHRVSRI